MITKVHPAKANGTSLKGYITTTFNKLVETFGSPSLNNPPSEMEKVTREWILCFPCGTIATVYNWKNYGNEPADNEQYRWHIGGNTSEAVELVQASVNQTS